MTIKRIFTGNEENVLIFVDDNSISQYDTTSNQIIGRLTLEDNDVRSLVFGYDKIAIVSKSILLITDQRFEVISTIK